MIKKNIIYLNTELTVDYIGNETKGIIYNMDVFNNLVDI
jgi:hypothetical protein